MVTADEHRVEQHYQVRAWIPYYGGFRPLGTMPLAERTEGAIIARFEAEGLRASVEPVNADGTVPNRAVVSVYGPVGRKG